MNRYFGCMICGIKKEHATAPKCYEDIAKDRLVQGHGLEDTEHLWTPVTLVKWRRVSQLPLLSEARSDK